MLVSLFAFTPEVNIEDQPTSVHLLVRTGPGTVLVFIVRIDIRLPAERKYTTCIDRSRAPLIILAAVVKLGAGVGRRMVGVDCNRFLQCQSVAIAPGRIAVGVVDFQTIPVGNQHAALEWEIRGGHEKQTILRRFAW